MRVLWEDVTSDYHDEEESGKVWENGNFLIFKRFEEDYMLTIPSGERTVGLLFDTEEEAKDYVQALFELPLTIRNIGDIIDKAEFNQDLREKVGLERKW